MPHRIAARGRIDSVDVAAVWPVSAQVAPVPIPDVEPRDAQRAGAGPTARQGIESSSGGSGAIPMLILPVLLMLGLLGFAVTSFS